MPILCGRKDGIHWESLKKMNFEDVWAFWSAMKEELQVLGWNRESIGPEASCQMLTLLSSYMSTDMDTELFEKKVRFFS